MHFREQPGESTHLFPNNFTSTLGRTRICSLSLVVVEVPALGADSRAGGGGQWWRGQEKRAWQG